MPGLNKNRKRNLTVAFRATPEENDLINLLANTAHMTKQEYIMSKLTDTTIVVQPNTKTYKALKDEMAKIYVELERIRYAGDMDEGLVQKVILLASIFQDLGANESKSLLDRESTAITEMVRG